MSLLFTLLMSAVLALLAVPALTFVAQVLLGCLNPRRATSSLVADASRGRVAVLVPAHNESLGIERTVRSVLPQLRLGDRLLVVADNCQDDTATVARALGAEVTERQHADLRGKGFALDHGVAQLRASPPDMVLMIDADCTLHPGSLEVLAARCQSLDRPVQGCDLMLAPPGAPLKVKVAALAWMVKNRVRPLGGAALGWPCQLMGTGMIFPWGLIHSAPLASGHLAEDMQLGAVLAAQGHVPAYCDEALVTSMFPLDDGALTAQRTRWEHGHLGMIFHQGPRLLALSWRQRSWPLLGLALDMCVPPLTSLVMLISLAVLASAVLAFAGAGWAWLVVAGALWVGVALSVLFAWASHGRNIISAQELLSIPLYVLSKVSIYAGFIARRQTRWIRTRRDDEQK